MTRVRGGGRTNEHFKTQMLFSKIVISSRSSWCENPEQVGDDQTEAGKILNIFRLASLEVTVIRMFILSKSWIHLTFLQYVRGTFFDNRLL